MSCEACISAAENPNSGMYSSNCLECDCRALAHSPEAWKAMNGQSNAPLQQAMDRLAGYQRDKYLHIRGRVWAWIERIKGAKA